MRRFLMTLLSVAFVFSLSAVATPQKAEGYTYFFQGQPWYVSNIRWCFAELGTWPGLGLSQYVYTIEEAFENFDEQMSNRTISRVAGTGCEVEVHIADFSAKGFPNVPMRTSSSLTSDGNWIYDSDIWINSDFTNQFWFSTNKHNCTVVCATMPHDFFTLVTHEFGHAIGLGHSTNTDTCNPGYDSERTDLACTNDYYARDAMYAFGDGYRRWLTTDSLNGLASMGYG